MSFKLKSKRKTVGKAVSAGSGCKITKITKSSKIIDLETRAVNELENLAKRQSETRVYKSPSLVVNKRSFAKSLVSVEKHNLKIKNCSDRKNLVSKTSDSRTVDAKTVDAKIVDTKKKFSALSYDETDDQNSDKNVNKIDLTKKINKNTLNLNSFYCE
jgi:hypothetical protein